MPCTMVCLTPVIIASWPSILSFVAGAASALGLTSAVTSRKKVEAAQTNVAELELKDSFVLESSGTDGVEFVKEGVKLTVGTNEQDRLLLRAEGTESKEILHRKAQNFADSILQAYTYNRAITKLRQSGFTMVEENITEDRVVHVTLRRW